MKKAVPNAAYDVKAWRRRMGLTQEEAAKLIDCRARSIRRWEREGVPPLRFFINVMKREERKRFQGTAAPAPVTPTPKVRPKATSGISEPPRSFGIMPGSW